MSVLHLLSRVCEGERRAKHFIFNLASLYPTFRESRHRTFKKESHNERSRSMAREAVVRRHSFAQQVMRFHVIVLCAFVLLSASKRGGCARETKSVRDTPMCQSKCPFKNLRSRKKRREDFKRGRRHFLRSLKLTLSLTLFPFIMVRVVVTIENRAARIGWRTM